MKRIETLDLDALVLPILPDPLVDHDCQGVRRDELGRSQFEMLIAPAGMAAPPGTTHFDTPLGVAIRRWCGPVLGLEPHAPPAVYLARRAELGAGEVNRRLLRAAGIVAFLVDATTSGPELLTAAELGRLGGAAADEIVRIEDVEQEVAESGRSSVGYVEELRDRLAARAGRAVALKTMVARHHGLDVEPSRPSRGTVLASAGRRLAGPREPLADPVLLRHVLWTAVDAARERGLPLQIQCGYGPGHDGAGAPPHRSDPSLMTDFIRALMPLGVPVVLLRCYPFHREAAHLAGVFPHVYVDVPAPAASEVLALAPFHKQMFGSGGRGVAETCLLGALAFRRALTRALTDRIAAGEWSAADAARVADMIGSGNARRVYRL
ncbi:amidohydrolase family protein [Streptosporangiaceae bacterium NEAU-GS5]|nr:amidohydrolase family protein [Streptosporangiaceae bacterium NEAU-GS5]